MATVIATINDPQAFPGADLVTEQGPGGYAVYGPEKDGVHRAIAVMRRTKSGKFLVEASPTVISQLGPSTPVTDAEALIEWPIYETTVEVKTPGRPDSTAVHIGPKPTGTTLHGRRILSTKPAAGWTLKKMLDLEYQIADPVIEDDEPDDEPSEPDLHLIQ